MKDTGDHPKSFPEPKKKVIEEKEKGQKKRTAGGK